MALAALIIALIALAIAVYNFFDRYSVKLDARVQRREGEEEA